MNLKDWIPENLPCILVEGPRWADTEFYGKWLLAAAKAHALSEKAGFKGLNVAATGMLAYLWRDRVAVKVCSSDWIFIMMVELGLFVRTGQRYQMVIPAGVTMGKVKRFALKFADDEEYTRYLEQHVAIMPIAEAKAWQARLLDMDQDQRCADRNLLLETPSDFVVQN